MGTGRLLDVHPTFYTISLTGTSAEHAGSVRIHACVFGAVGRAGAGPGSGAGGCLPRRCAGEERAGEGVEVSVRVRGVLHAPNEEESKHLNKGN